jgi:hypothetical protein
MPVRMKKARQDKNHAPVRRLLRTGPDEGGEHGPGARAPNRFAREEAKVWSADEIEFICDSLAAPACADLTFRAPRRGCGHSAPASAPKLR